MPGSCSDSGLVTAGKRCLLSDLKTVMGGKNISSLWALFICSLLQEHNPQVREETRSLAMLLPHLTVQHNLGTVRPPRKRKKKKPECPCYPDTLLLLQK